MKSIDEAAKEHAIRNGMAGWLYDSFKAGIEFAERWIPVEEELPEFFGKEFYILCKCKKDGDLILVLIEEQEDIHNIKIDCTHWRQINHK